MLPKSEQQDLQGVAIMRISNRDLATLLAALEYWKEELANGRDWIPESAFFEKFSPLSVSEIDELVDRMKHWKGSSSSPDLSFNCRSRPDQIKEESLFNVPTYYGNACQEEIERGEREEFDDPQATVLIYQDAGLRILLGTDDYDDDDKPDIKIERRPKGWAIFLHPSADRPKRIHLLFGRRPQLSCEG